MAKYKNKAVSLCVLVLSVLASMGIQANSGKLVTPNASPETRALYKNLSRLSGEYLLFGHQNTTAYGVRWFGDENRSDVKDVTGSYPAVFGWDLGGLVPGNEVERNKSIMANLTDEIKRTYRRGGVSTISWHMRDPVSGKSSWNKDHTVGKILPGASHHDALKAYLDLFVEFNEGLQVVDENGKSHYIPVIFRPWHEHNGDWFWWGKGNASEKEFVQLWRFTIDYLRNKKGLSNLIFAFSPDRSRMNVDDFRGSYLYAYPGDDYVDVLGIDNYWDLGHPENTTPLAKRKKYFVESLEAVTDLAEEKNKIAALTEGGQETIHQEKFWTEMILNNIQANDRTKRISWFLVWRNANKEREKRDHYYAPYRGHKSEKDFMEFYNSPITLFENQLPDMYK